MKDSDYQKLKDEVMGLSKNLMRDYNTIVSGNIKETDEEVIITITLKK